MDIDGFTIINDEKYALLLGTKGTDYVIDLDSLQIKMGQWSRRNGGLLGVDFDMVCCSKYDIMYREPLISGCLRENNVGSNYLLNNIIQVIKIFMDMEQAIHLMRLYQHVKVDLNEILEATSTLYLEDEYVIK